MTLGTTVLAGRAVGGIRLDRLWWAGPLLMLAVSGAACARHGSEDRSASNPPNPPSSVAPSDTVAPSSTAEPPDEDAPRLLRSYYDAIQAKRYRDAYLCWGGLGESSRQTYEAFARGFAHTDSVAASFGTPSPVGAAAGSRYITIPVRIVAHTTDGGTQEFSGTYTLRRSVVDGATAEQRQWRIYSAEIRKER